MRENQVVNMRRSFRRPASVCGASVSAFSSGARPMRRPPRFDLPRDNKPNRPVERKRPPIHCLRQWSYTALFRSVPTRTLAAKDTTRTPENAPKRLKLFKHSEI